MGSGSRRRGQCHARPGSTPTRRAGHSVVERSSRNPGTERELQQHKVENADPGHRPTGRALHRQQPPQRQWIGSDIGKDRRLGLFGRCSRRVERMLPRRAGPSAACRRQRNVVPPGICLFGFGPGGNGHMGIDRHPVERPLSQWVKTLRRQRVVPALTGVSSNSLARSR